MNKKNKEIKEIKEIKEKKEKRRKEKEGQKGEMRCKPWQPTTPRWQVNRMFEGPKWGIICVPEEL